MNYRLKIPLIKYSLSFNINYGYNINNMRLVKNVK